MQKWENHGCVKQACPKSYLIQPQGWGAGRLTPCLARQRSRYDALQSVQDAPRRHERQTDRANSQGSKAVLKKCKQMMGFEDRQGNGLSAHARRSKPVMRAVGGRHGKAEGQGCSPLPLSLLPSRLAAHALTFSRAERRTAVLLVKCE